VDAQGRVVPACSNQVQFSVAGEGTLEGVDNGDPASDELFKASTRSLYQGRAIAVIRSTRKPGEIRLQATVDGMKPAISEIKTQPMVEPVKVLKNIPEVESMFSRMRREGQTGITISNASAVTSTPKPIGGKPETFTFQSLIQGDFYTIFDSNTIEVKGLTGITQIYIAEKNSDASYCINDGEFISRSGTVKNGDRVRVRLMTGPAENTRYFLMLNIGGQVSQYSVTTK
jgi:hypothetical protein